VLVIELVTWCR